MHIRRLPEFDRWIRRLRDEIAVVAITRRISRLKLGNPGDSKNVGGGVVEMRIDHGPGYRVYFTRRGTDLILLLCGGDKSTQADDIHRARLLALSIKDDR